MSQLAKENPLDGASPHSTLPTVPNESTGFLGPNVTRATIAPSSARGSGTATPSTGSTLPTRESILAAHLDITPSLQKAVHSVVKARTGSVLSRGFILKTDHYPSGESFKLFWGTRALPGCYRCFAITNIPAIQLSIQRLSEDLILIDAVLSR